MAGKRLSLGEVMDGLDGSDFEDDSDDDFDGYLDMDMDDEFDSEEELREEGARVQESVETETEEEGEERRVLRVQESVGAEVEVVSSGDGSDSVPNYTLPAGCATPVEGESPLDFFSLLLTDSMLHNIVAQTNLSAQQFIESHELAPHSRVRRWSKSEHNIDELRQFLAIIIIMGLVRYPQIEHHWATQWPYSNTHFSSVS